MDRTELKNILREEGSSSLKSLPGGFFNDAAIYVKELEEEIQKIGNSRSIESKMLEDELQNALTDIEVIFMRRYKKVINSATTTAFSSRSAIQDMSKLHPEEKKVYGAILSTIQTARQKLLEPIMDPKAARSKNKEGKSLNGSMRDENGTNGSAHDPSGQEHVGKSNINEEFVVVRILEDLPTFKAMDNRSYTLRAEDVVVIPALNAKGLVKRNVAQIIHNN
jgi:DNA replication factor GINS